ncbi:MAG: class I SAM-dependent rRNA methyltransferase [Myxococcales bacterium]|nr:class I SAM-dependent rRNA methyltransferase [Myxococcales bacterium]
MMGEWLPRSAIWPAVSGEWLLAERDDWLALAKPPGIACPPGPERHDPTGVRNDVAARLRMHWRGAVGVDPATALHVMFDALDGGVGAGPDAGLTASGVVIVARRPDVADEMTRAELQGRVRLTTVVGVAGWPRDVPAERVRLDGISTQLLALGMRIAAVRAVGRRALLTLHHASGRGLDVATELERLGLSIAAPRAEGLDVPPDGSAAPVLRRIVHRLAVDMPAATVEAPLPAEAQRWLAADSEEPFDDRLDGALRRRFVLGHSDDTDAYRLIDGTLDDVSIDRYGPDLVLSSHVEFREHAGAHVVARLTAQATQIARHVGERLEARAVYLKLRPRQANVVADAVAAGLAPEEPVFGSPPLPDPLAPEGGALVVERGLRFRVRLGGGLGTGIYLDQRDNRAWVREHAAGRRVLNTFAYTCAFSVAAAAGGALRTVSIDAGAPMLAEGRGNLELNGHIDSDRHDLIRGDVFQWLPKLARRGDRFDLLILDPPSYSRVKGRRFSAERDYGHLVASALALVAPGGLLLACTNCAAVDRRRFHQMVLDGASLAGRRVASIAHRPTPLDHPGGRMKSLVLMVD